MHRVRLLLAVAACVASFFTVGVGTAPAISGTIAFDVTNGSTPPRVIVGPFEMTPFGLDGPASDNVAGVPGRAGDPLFPSPLDRGTP